MFDRSPHHGMDGKSYISNAYHNNSICGAVNGEHTLYYLHQSQKYSELLPKELHSHFFMVFKKDMCGY